MRQRATLKCVLGLAVLIATIAMIMRLSMANAGYPVGKVPEDDATATLDDCCWCTCYAHDRRPDLRGVCENDAKFWAEDARSAGYPVGKVPRDDAIVVFQPGVQGADYCQEDYCYGHVAFVENVYSTTDYRISEKGWYGDENDPWDPCVVHYRNAETGDGVDFIYKIEGTHLLMQLLPTEIWPPSPICAPNQISFGLDIKNYGEKGTCPEFHFLFIRECLAA